MKKKSIFSTGSASLFRTIIATIGVATICFLCSLFYSSDSYAKEPVSSATKVDFVAKLCRIYTDSINVYDVKLDSIQNRLINEVDNYIQTYSKNSKMSGENIVIKCIENDYDIPLLMAQAHQETHFGEGNKRNNVFGIVGKRYSHPDKAVDDYISLMKRKYIINRTPEQLIKSGFRLEKGKGKYAADTSYGAVIGKIRNNIIKNTEIFTLYNEYKSLINSRNILQAQLNMLLNKGNLTTHIS